MEVEASAAGAEEASAAEGLPEDGKEAVVSNQRSAVDNR